MTIELSINNVSQVYGNKKTALSEINLTLTPGLTALLGSNGAGKSTLMRLMASINKPTQGDIFWRGECISHSPQLLRSELGYLPQYFGLYENLSATEFLRYSAALKKVPSKLAKTRIRQLLEELNLEQVAHQPIQSYSGGMKQRVGIAQALLNDPKLLILDEPTVGLDPQERGSLRNLLSDLAAERIVVLSTHIVSDIEDIADSIALMHQGRLVHYASANHLLNTIRDSVWQCQLDAQGLAQVKQKHCVSHSLREQDLFNVRVVSHQKPVESAKRIVPCLEDAFLFAKNQLSVQQGV